MQKKQTLEDKIRKWKKQAEEIEKELQKKRERKAGRLRAKKKNA
jgi:hypothetical protein